ncbi:MAG TPA: hypothetical protein VFT45_01190 [Longimicrobium sp.]|nr:hypothetical protein [Longimicrobium sp.]
MKMCVIALVTFALVAPAPARAQSACDQINGPYVGGRTGTIHRVPAIVFDRITLQSGIGDDGHQVTTAPDSASASHLRLRVKECIPLAPNRVRLTLATATPGAGHPWIDAGSAVVTIYDGGARLWVVGETAGAEFPGWLLRIPPAPRA